MKKILVTGASGFIGKHVITCLLKQSYQVIATSRNQATAEKQSWYKKVTYIPYDINKPANDLYTLFHKPDSVIHLAWEGLPDYRSLQHFQTTLPAQYNFITNLLNNGLKQIIISGTCFEYGLKEGCLNENMNTVPYTSYGFAKDTLHKMLKFYLQDKNGKTLIWTRLFYTYGEGQNPQSFVPQLQQAIKNKDKEFKMSAGDQKRDYLPVKELAQKLCRLVTLNKTQTLNICSGKPITILALAEKIKNEFNSTIHLNTGSYDYPEYEPFAFWGDNRKYSLNATE